MRPFLCGCQKDNVFIIIRVQFQWWVVKKKVGVKKLHRGAISIAREIIVCRELLITGNIISVLLHEARCLGLIYVAVATDDRARLLPVNPASSNLRPLLLSFSSILSTRDYRDRTSFLEFTSLNCLQLTD